VELIGGELSIYHQTPISQKKTLKIEIVDTLKRN